MPVVTRRCHLGCRTRSVAGQNRFCAAVCLQIEGVFSQAAFCRRWIPERFQRYIRFTFRIFLNLDSADLDFGARGHIADLQQNFQRAAFGRCHGVRHRTGADRFRAEAVLRAGSGVLVARCAAACAVDVHADPIGLTRFERYVWLGIQFHMPVVTRRCNGHNRA